MCVSVCVCVCVVSLFSVSLCIRTRKSRFEAIHDFAFVIDTRISSLVGAVVLVHFTLDHHCDPENAVGNRAESLEALSRYKERRRRRKRRKIIPKTYPCHSVDAVLIHYPFSTPTQHKIHSVAFEN